MSADDSTVIIPERVDQRGVVMKYRVEVLEPSMLADLAERWHNLAYTSGFAADARIVGLSYDNIKYELRVEFQ